MVIIEDKVLCMSTIPENNAYTYVFISTSFCPKNNLLLKYNE